MSRGGRKRWGETGFEAWGGYMEAKKAKLEDQFANEAELEDTGIFHGVAIFVNGYTDPSSDELKRIMMIHGGTFHHYFNSQKTTHIIATNLPDAKVKALKGNEPICKPDWILDSVKQGKLLDFRDYLLYSNCNKTQPKLNFDRSLGIDLPPDPGTGSSGAKDAKDPKFLEEFYNNSRLHHISTMGANFKQYINDLRINHNGKFPDREKLKKVANNSPELLPPKGKIYMHIDMDCFFVSVGLRSRPDLIGKPVAVAHAKGAGPVSREVISLRKEEMKFYQKRKEGANDENNDKISKADLIEFSSMSELASVSYEARAKGVRNGMFLGGALKLCPDLKTIPYDFDGYQQVAFILYDTVSRYTINIQAVSCDEMLVDITELLKTSLVDPIAFAEHLRKEIYDQTRCHASVGLGSNLLLARMATKKAKPNGSFMLSKGDSPEEFMRSMMVKDLPGIGRKIGRRLNEMSIETCQDLQQLALSKLKSEFGDKNGEAFYNFCRGIDNRVLNLNQERKSVSAEVNYGIRFSSELEGTKFISQLCSEVELRLEKLGMKGKCITLKMMVRAANAPKETSKFLGHGVCDSLSKSCTLSSFTRDANVIQREVSILIKHLDVSFEDIRGIGIQMSKLDGNKGQSSSSLGSNSMLKFLTKKKISTEPGPSSGTGTELKESQASNVTARSSHTDTSFSQIDPEILAALPVEIQKEIQDDLDKKKKNRVITMKKANEGPSTTGTSDKTYVEKGIHNDLKVKRSPLEEDFVQDRIFDQMNMKENEESERNIFPDLSLSQVDPEFISALPEDIAKEVKESLSKPSMENEIDAKDDNPFQKIIKASKSLLKESPIKSRRGRPPKNPPKFVKKSLKSPNQSNSVTTLFSKSPDEQQAHNPEIPFDIEEIIALQKDHSDLNEARALLRSWTLTLEPSKDDLETVSKYLQDLVEVNKLTEVMLLLKLLCRRTRALTSCWQQGYSHIVENVQKIMLKTYGRRLFVAIL